MDLPSWGRARYEPGGGNALIFYALYGEFPKEIRLSGEGYRTSGVPEGVALRKLNRAQTPDFPFTSEGIGGILRPPMPELFTEIQRAPECLVVQGEIPDPKDLNYLRDTVGLIMYFLDNGARAVMDPQRLRLYNSSTWSREIFAPDPPNLLNHVVILESPESGGTQWIRTRGMRKFGRPDLSAQGVSEGDAEAVVEACNELIRRQAEGGRILEGEGVKLEATGKGLSCHHGGSLDDPDFNNVHVELRRVK